MPARIVGDWFGSELNTNNISNISDSATSDFFEIRSFFYWEIVADCMFECTNVQFFAPPAGGNIHQITLVGATLPNLKSRAGEGRGYAEHSN